MLLRNISCQKWSLHFYLLITYLRLGKVEQLQKFAPSEIQSVRIQGE